MNTPRKVRRINPIVMVGGFVVLAAIAIVAAPRDRRGRSASVPAIRSDVRTSGGLPLASIFDGVTGSQLPVAIVNALVAEAKAPPRDPCHKNAKSSWSKFLEAFDPPSVFAQCESDCTSHYNKPWSPPSDCWSLELCEYGPVYSEGCMGALYDCGGGGWACGQYTCPNP